VGCLTAVIGLLTMGAVASAAASTALMHAGVLAQIRSLQARLEELRTRRAEREAADDLIREVSLHVRAERMERGEFPHRPGEALPDDPWGTPLEYERIDRSHARVRSAGPDREFGSDDDLEAALD
jgi:hypothetical protein